MRKAADFLQPGPGTVRCPVCSRHFVAAKRSPLVTCDDLCEELAQQHEQGELDLGPARTARGRRAGGAGARAMLTRLRGMTLKELLSLVKLSLLLVLCSGCLAELPPEKAYSKIGDWLTVVLDGAYPLPVAQAAWRARAGKLAAPVVVGGLGLGGCAEPAAAEWRVSAVSPPPRPKTQEAEGAPLGGSTTIEAPLRCQVREGGADGR